MDRLPETLKSKKKIKDWSVGFFICMTIIILLVCSFISSTMVQGVMSGTHYYRTRASRVICASNIKQIGIALHVYASENDDMLPSKNWSDALKDYLDEISDVFVCRGSEHLEGESSYAFNIEAAGRKLSELPKNMVLLFETDSLQDGKRWNQVGGPESLTLNNHKGKGLGTKLVQACHKKSKQLGIKKVFALTFKPKFFLKLKYKRISRNRNILYRFRTTRNCI